MTAPAGYNTVQTPRFTPQQMDIFSQMGTGLQGGLASGLERLNKIIRGDPEFFKQLEAPAYANLEKGLAQTANRFSMHDAQGSSAFQNMLAGQSQDLAMNLQSQRQQLMDQAMRDLFGLEQSFLGAQPYETMLQKEGGMSGLLETLGEKGPDLLIELLKLYNPALGTAAQVGKSAITG